jgi:sec-independent protein translocase protein TatA
MGTTGGHGWDTLEGADFQRFGWLPYGIVEACMFEGLFQPMHLLVIFAIALLVFGPKKLPELGKGLGDGIRALKEGMKGDDAKAAEARAAEAKTTEAKSQVKPENPVPPAPENKV